MRKIFSFYIFKSFPVLAANLQRNHKGKLPARNIRISQSLLIRQILRFESDMEGFQKKNTLFHFLRFLKIFVGHIVAILWHSFCHLVIYQTLFLHYHSLIIQLFFLFLSLSFRFFNFPLLIFPFLSFFVHK